MSSRDAWITAFSFRMDRAAKFVGFCPDGMLCSLRYAIPQVDAVGRLPRRSVVAGTDDLVIVHNDGAEPAPEAGASHGDGSGDVRRNTGF